MKPLLVWLHGLGEAGDNNSDQLAWLELLFQDQPNQSPPCYILALQRPAKAPYWRAINSTQRHPLQIVNQALEETLHRHPIDRRRIYLAGISSGASGCWEYAKRQPARFAAMVPMASTTVDMTRLEQLTELPVWAFQATGDGAAAVQQTRKLVRRLRRLGGRVHLTVVDQPTHDCWTSALVDKQIGRWMLAQRRDAAMVPPPGWTVWQFKATMVAVTLLIVLAAAATWRSRFRRRRGPRRRPMKLSRC